MTRRRKHSSSENNDTTVICPHCGQRTPLPDDLHEGETGAVKGWKALNALLGRTNVTDANDWIDLECQNDNCHKTYLINKRSREVKK